MGAPRRRFGQHFLKDEAVLDRIVRAVAPRPGDRLVEIGPGRGALTRPLLEAGGRLTVVEIDRDLAPALPDAVGGGEGLTVLTADALRVDFTDLARIAGGPLRLTGNLPYNVSTPLLFHLLGHAGAITDMTFMLQKEVVDRLCAEPGTPDYGRLTVAVAARAGCDALFEVGPEAFTPPPKVQSAVVRITPRPAPFGPVDLARYDALAARAFTQRRKTLANALRGLLGAEAIAAAGIDPGLRPGALSPAQFAALAAQLPDPGAT